MPKEHVDPVPELTKDKLAENAEFQEQMRRRFELKPKDHAERTIAANLRRIGQFSEQLEGSDDVETRTLLIRRITALRDETALYLKQKGLFAEAAKLAANTNIRAEARSYVTAREIDNDLWCEHSMWKQTDAGMVPNYVREFDYVEGGQNLSMLRCNECGFRNARPLPKDMQNLIAARAKIREQIIANDMKLPTNTDISLEKLANG